MPLVYDELRRRAGSYLRGERPDHTLQPTALVHEAYVKLVNQREAKWKDRAHFCAVAAEAMRRILIDHARKHRAARRGGGGQRVTLCDAIGDPRSMEVDVIDLDDALTRLRELHERQSRVVELRFFGGLSVEEIAEILEVSPRTVKGDWRVARAWLQTRLVEEGRA